jgi:hypothetical protein
MLLEAKEGPILLADANATIRILRTAIKFNACKGALKNIVLSWNLFQAGTKMEQPQPALMIITGHC